MRRPLGRALAVATLLAGSSSWAAGWAVTFHLASDDHHGRASSDAAGTVGLMIGVHGHLHAEGTPSHSHPVVASAAASLPGRLSLLVPAMTGDTPEALGVADARHWPPSRPGPNHDPPPSGVSVSILRI